MTKLLTTEDDWANAQMLIMLAFGATDLPIDCGEKCDRCAHIGWRWEVGSLRLCLDHWRKAVDDGSAPVLSSP